MRPANRRIRRDHRELQFRRHREVGSQSGTTTGKVVRKLTKPTTIKTHKVAASKDNPEYLVESGKTGARAAHKPSELRKA
jgi:hypothetical protein